MNIYTGCYDKCKTGNLISISFDKGKDAGFNGKTMTELAPFREFFHRHVRLLVTGICSSLYSRSHKIRNGSGQR